MDIDTLIYIFFIVISIIASISRSSSKKKKRRSIIPDILSDEFPQYKEEEPYDPFEDSSGRFAKPVEDQEKQSVTPEIPSYDNAYEDEQYQNKMSAGSTSPQTSVKETSKPKNKSAIYQVEETGYEISDFEFDPLKAIIYSEILKRPEY